MTELCAHLPADLPRDQPALSCGGHAEPIQLQNQDLWQLSQPVPANHVLLGPVQVHSR